MNYRRSAAPLICCFVLAAPTTRAAGDAPKPQTLAQALALAAPPKSELYIAVGADQVTPPKDGPALFDGESAAQTAQAFGQNVGAFGDVEAIAPRTVMVVDVPPNTPNVYDGMEPKQIVKLLAGTFSKEQWRAFLSEDGLAYASLTRDDQRRIFEALFPDGKMLAVRFDPSGAQQSPTELSGDSLRAARLRLATRTDIALSVPGEPNSHVFAGSYTPPDSPGFYVMSNSSSNNVDREFGAWVRETVPNTLKPSDLDSDDAAWKTLVPLVGARTVDDVARAVAAATQREVYADPRYGKKTVTMAGPAAPRRAYDLMRALAMCVGGAWRKVGPSLVLTNDRIGLAVKQELWKAFEAKAEALAPTGDRYTPATQPDGAAFTVKDIPSTGDDFPFSDKEREMYWKKFEEDNTRSMSGSNMIQLTLPFRDLTPVQQDAARHIQEANAKDHIASTLDGDVMIQSEPMVEILMPSIPVPVIVPNACEILLPYLAISDAAIARAQRDEAESQAAKAGPPLPDKAPTADEMRAMIHTFGRRAALVEAGTVEEIDKNIAALKTLGLNELWLRVPLGADGEGDDTALDLLRHAAKGAQAAHIALYPAFRLLAWGDKAPEGLKDRTILGATDDTVTPFAPEAIQRMAAIVGKAARLPGVAGMLWTDSAPPGYTDKRSLYNPPLLGYAAPGRLASLRASHTDPLDLTLSHGLDMRANITLPDFGDNGTNAQMYDAWSKLRVTARRAFVAAIASALPASYSPGPHSSPIITPPADGDLYRVYGSWDDTAKPQPAVTVIPFPGPDGKPAADGSGVQSMASETVYHSVSLGEPDDTAPPEVLRDVSRQIQEWLDDKVPNIVFTAADPRILPRLADAVKNAK
ncbi:MAG: hypothetical protein ABIY70_26180 [Capsulimonas sp.]|uniref:hypothetical protein n=1 Tax=Capsulimonas sp. TaxID=2494211 RepID=UPI0032638D4D